MIIHTEIVNFSFEDGIPIARYNSYNFAINRRSEFYPKQSVGFQVASNTFKSSK